MAGETDAFSNLDVSQEVAAEPGHDSEAGSEARDDYVLVDPGDTVTPEPVSVPMRFAARV